MELKNIAITNFRSGLNCAQSVISTFTEKYTIDKSAALMLSCGFGAGMGRLQETCGAVTGAFMALGVHVCKNVADNKERKEQSYALIRDFERLFREKHGTCRCADLIKVDLKTPEGQHEFHEKNMHEEICEKCIADAVEIVQILTHPSPFFP
jgi:C_GCAxxG_C_C family probable redox protein